MEKSFKVIDTESWIRKNAFGCFASSDNSCCGFDARIDVTQLVDLSRETATKFFANMLYLVCRSLNECDEFRLRVVKGKVLAFDVIDPSFVAENGAGAIVSESFPMTYDYKSFYGETVRLTEKAKADLSQGGFGCGGSCDVSKFYVSSMSGLDFLSGMHPIPSGDLQSQSIPRVAWGKYVRETYIERTGNPEDSFGGEKGVRLSDRYAMTLNIVVSHALMDGRAVAAAFSKIQENVNLARKLLV